MYETKTSDPSYYAKQLLMCDVRRDRGGYMTTCIVL